VTWCASNNKEQTQKQKPSKNKDFYGFGDGAQAVDLKQSNNSISVKQI
jgi:hypothetical protein